MLFALMMNSICLYACKKMCAYIMSMCLHTNVGMPNYVTPVISFQTGMEITMASPTTIVYDFTSKANCLKWRGILQPALGKVCTFNYKLCAPHPSLVLYYSHIPSFLIHRIFKLLLFFAYSEILLTLTWHSQAKKSINHERESGIYLQEGARQLGCTHMHQSLYYTQA